MAPWGIGVFTVESQDFDQIQTIAQTDSLNIDNSSVSFHAVFHPGGPVDWVFTWETDYWSDASLDQVEIELSSGMNCADLGDGYLTAEDSGVSTLVTYQVDTQDFRSLL